MGNSRLPSALMGPLIAVISVFVTFLIVEIGYRVYLHSHTILNYNAASNAICTYDSLFGYRYVPGTDGASLCVRKGVPRMYFHVKVGPFSNLGDETEFWDNNDTRILGFGDSFTADPFSYHSWTTHLDDDLSGGDFGKVTVMNLGRDAYGVLQMARLASRKVREYTPTVAIVAFIMDDLSRARFWRSVDRTDGRERLWTTVVPDSTPDNALSEDVALIDHRIGVGWCETMVTQSRTDDPLLSSLNQEYRTLAPDNFLHGLGSLSTSFLYNRLVHGDAFYSLRKPSHFPQVTIHDFRSDSLFVQDMRILDSSGVPIYWIRLPRLQDLQAGAYVATEQQQQLFESLRTFMGRNQKLVDLLPFVHPGTTPPDSLFLLPYDVHPSELGSRLYAKAIASAISPYLKPPQKSSTPAPTEIED